jgi:rare lipoprotein A
MIVATILFLSLVCIEGNHRTLEQVEQNNLPPVETIFTQGLIEENIVPIVETRPISTYTARASWYQMGRVTANGERYNPDGLTVAHRRYPFGTVIRLTNPTNGRSVIVRVNDRGPFIRGRDFDVSRGAARQLDFIDRGVVNLVVEVLYRT